jgi:hypothetical protein
MELIKGLVKIELEYIGEGLNGDFNPNDPDDIKLLRYTVSRIEDDDIVPIDDASYCTLLPESASSTIQTKALYYLMSRLYEPITQGLYIKKLCEDLSWLELETFAKESQ